jgi:UDP-N-acetylmuramoyl-L-alanyl-D-glutamate--2,6-diaminopimelate ligase
MKGFFQLLKKILGKRLTVLVRPFGHGLKAYLAAFYYGLPAKKLKIIGITGTKGKTTTTVFTGRLLNLLGIKTGYISTSVICESGKLEDEILNPFKMTAIDAVFMQKSLKEMIKNGCKHLVIEMSSQGLEQNRHFGLFGFDFVSILNMYPEHLEAHGGWDNYVKAKGILFQNIRSNGVFLGNYDKEQANISETMWKNIPTKFKAHTHKIQIKPFKSFGSSDIPNSIFKNLHWHDKILLTSLIADFDITNLFFAIQIALQVEEKSSEQILQDGFLQQIKSVPGRMEWVVFENKVV